jgi:uncharacterized paraquat-inducible protein A
MTPMKIKGNELILTLEEWKQAVERSEPCPGCGCKLVEIDEENNTFCPRCGLAREYA